MITEPESVSKICQVPNASSISSISVRLGREEDLPAIIEIYNEAVLEGNSAADIHPVSVQERRDWMRVRLGPTGLILVATRGSTIIGWASYAPFKAAAIHAGVAEVSFYVSSRVRGLGAGSTLMAALLAEGSARAVLSVLGFANGTNSPSIRLMESCGFKRWGLLPSLVNTPVGNLDCVVYGRHLCRNRQSRCVDPTLNGFGAHTAAVGMCLESEKTRENEILHQSIRTHNTLPPLSQA